MTVEQNILLGQIMNRKKYNKVLDACALKADLDVLSDGDQTEIGEKVGIVMQVLDGVLIVTPTIKAYKRRRA